MPLGLEHASYSLPEWQVVKLTLFAPWGGMKVQIRESLVVLIRMFTE